MAITWKNVGSSDLTGGAKIFNTATDSIKSAFDSGSELFQGLYDRDVAKNTEDASLAIREAAKAGLGEYNDTSVNALKDQFRGHVDATALTNLYDQQRGVAEAPIEAALRTGFIDASTPAEYAAQGEKLANSGLSEVAIAKLRGELQTRSRANQLYNENQYDRNVRRNLTSFINNKSLSEYKDVDHYLSDIDDQIRTLPAGEQLAARELARNKFNSVRTGSDTLTKLAAIQATNLQTEQEINDIHASADTSTALKNGMMLPPKGEPAGTIQDTVAAIYGDDTQQIGEITAKLKAKIPGITPEISRYIMNKAHENQWFNSVGGTPDDGDIDDEILNWTNKYGKDLGARTAMFKKALAVNKDKYDGYRSAVTTDTSNASKKFKRDALIASQIARGVKPENLSKPLTYQPIDRQGAFAGLGKTLTAEAQKTKDANESAVATAKGVLQAAARR